MVKASNIAIALRTAYLALHRQSEARFAKFGVTADQFVLLATLARGQALTQRELALRMSSDPSTVRAMLVLLEQRGLVERETHPTDSRARTVALTTAGKQAFRQLWAAGKPVRARMLGALQPGEAQMLITLLGRVAEALNADGRQLFPSTLPRMKHEQAHRGARRVRRASAPDRASIRTSR